MYSNILSKVNLFEHNESMNIMKHKVKYKDFKNVFIISIIFFVKFRKD